MKLYNTLSRTIEEVKPLNPDAIRLYSCGPTVYDHIHIGNLSSFIYADTLRRTLAAGGNQVKHVMNFTDIDDKTIKRSREKYPELKPAQALAKLTEEYSKIFLDDMKAAGNNTSAIDFVAATASIEQMQQLISQLYDDGFAYVTDDGVYFSLQAYKKSGKTYGQLTEITEDSTSQARIHNDEYDKESAHDFALWKVQKPDEPGWEFKLAGRDLKGRPGWHIECSAMSTASLGQPFDIHTGGVDLIFPHHENEIAQSTAGSSDSTYAKLFFHNEHLLVDGHKMSKSLNNFYTLKDIVDKGFEPLAFRLLVLQSHYRKQSNFSWENLEAAQNRLKSMQAFADLKHQPNYETRVVNEQKDQTYEAMIDGQLREFSGDLDTPSALSFLSSYISHIERSGYVPAHFQKLLDRLDDLYGLDLAKRPDITKQQKQMIDDRETARVASDWAKADQLRKQLEQEGIVLRDTDNGSIWSRS